MTTRYRLPEILGGAECVFHSVGYQDGCWIVELVDTVPGMRLELESSALVAVVSPLPPEPPVGSVVLDVSGRAWQHTGGHRGIWECCQDDAGADWEDLNAAPYAPLTLLVPAPEPVALPLRLEGLGANGDRPWSVEVERTGAMVLISATVNNRGAAVLLNAETARKAAAAILTAADAAEARS